MGGIAGEWVGGAEKVSSAKRRGLGEEREGRGVGRARGKLADFALATELPAPCRLLFADRKSTR